MASDGITRSPDLFPQTVPESSGLDPTSKRRLQNRLNQRASRQRRALQKSSLGGGRDQRWVIYTNEARIPPDDQSKKSSPVANTTSRLGKSQKVQNFGSSYYHAATQTIREQYWTQLKKKVAEGAANKVQSPQLLLPVTQFNSMRAMFENAASMGLTMDVLSEDIASCFNIAGPLNLRLPPSLEPSATQKSVVHHPWIDLLPIPSVRDALLRNMESCDEDELCGDLFGICGPAPEMGLLVWGESWDPSAYEVSERVLRKWRGFLIDCPDLLKSTNYWRKRRGEKALILANIEDYRVEEIKTP